MLGHRALENRLLTYFVDNGLMRENEPEQIIYLFKDLGIDVKLIDAKDKFFKALQGVIEPEEKREAITQTFYRDIFAQLARNSKAKFLLQGTILTDIDETKTGIKRQHNVFEQIGINPKETFGYNIIEPLAELRKDEVRGIAKELGLPELIYNRIPFPGPGLATRIIGEVTPNKIKIIKKATSITEEELADSKAFQYLCILHNDRVTGIRNGKRDFGLQIEIRCWESNDARIATPTKLPYRILETLAERITTKVFGVVSVTYNITSKPPSTIEAI